MNKPIIGIVSSKERIPKGSFQKDVHIVNLDYINMISNNNGIPLIIPYSKDLSSVERFVNIIDGLVLIGGEDVSKSCYTKSREVISDRDLFEIEMYKQCRNKKIPVLGICRGLQIINVVHGGTLKDIKETSIKHFIENDGWINHHEINIKNNTKLIEIMNVDEYVVSSVHHQQINKIGKNLIISSKSKDGIIESIESNDNFMIAFQGHIEKCLTNFDKYNDVIRYFIKEASNGKEI